METGEAPAPIALPYRVAHPLRPEWGGRALLLRGPQLNCDSRPRNPVPAAFRADARDEIDSPKVAAAAR